MKSGSPLFERIDKSIDKKVSLFSNSFSRYVARAILACLFLTLGTAVTFTIATKREGISHGSEKVFYAFMFSWSLVMILYMNVELSTSSMLYMIVGIYREKINSPSAAKILFTCILFSLASGILFGFLVSLTVPFQDLPKDSFFFTSIAGKLEKTTLQILIGTMFADIVVDAAVLVSIRMRDDAGKVAAIISIIPIFAFLGFEHVIANFLVFNLAYSASNGVAKAFTAGNVVHNLSWVFIGNFIDGGLIVGLGYAWLDKDNKNLTYFD